MPLPASPRARASRLKFQREAAAHQDEVECLERFGAWALAAACRSLSFWMIPDWAEGHIARRYPALHSNEPSRAPRRTDCFRHRPFHSGKALSGVQALQDTTITVAAVFPARKCRPLSLPMPEGIIFSLMKHKKNAHPIQL